ncbi:MAG TPA: hypothetical protein DCL48_12125 [Alphaproteobacteria bacterium]|nr:hypothetical protein [Alphaproteobacteria bacterium]
MSIVLAKFLGAMDKAAGLAPGRTGGRSAMIVERLSGVLTSEMFECGVDITTDEAQAMARAALRAIKPSDISDGMVEAYLRAHGGSDESVKKALFMGVNDFRRALAAAIAAGAEQ